MAQRKGLNRGEAENAEGNFIAERAGWGRVGAVGDGRLIEETTDGTDNGLKRGDAKTQWGIFNTDGGGLARRNGKDRPNPPRGATPQ